MSRKFGNLSTEQGKVVVMQILKYDLHFHDSLTGPLSERIRNTPNSKNKRPLSATSWRVLTYLCKANLAEETVSLSDVFLTLGVSKGTAISCLANLEDWEIIEKSPAQTDRRRLNIKLSATYEVSVSLFVDYWAERIDRGDVPFETPFQKKLDEGSNNGANPAKAKLEKIIHCADMLESQSLGAFTPNGYIQLASDIKEMASELISLSAASNGKPTKNK